MIFPLLFNKFSYLIYFHFYVFIFYAPHVLRFFYYLCQALGINSGVNSRNAIINWHFQLLRPRFLLANGLARLWNLLESQIIAIKMKLKRRRMSVSLYLYAHEKWWKRGNKNKTRNKENIQAKFKLLRFVTRACTRVLLKSIINHSITYSRPWHNT